MMIMLAILFFLFLYHLSFILDKIVKHFTMNRYKDNYYVLSSVYISQIPVTYVARD